jgi:hypothetical protein
MTLIYNFLIENIKPPPPKKKRKGKKKSNQHTQISTIQHLSLCHLLPFSGGRVKHTFPQFLLVFDAIYPGSS